MIDLGRTHLATKLYVPQPRPGAVPRAGCSNGCDAGLRQNGGFARKLTLISAPAGFGKTRSLPNGSPVASRSAQSCALHGCPLTSGTATPPASSRTSLRPC